MLRPQRSSQRDATAEIAVPLHGKALPPFAALKAFEAVGRLGGIRKAAKALSLHHAVVSRHMASLEEWLGVPLLHRQGRPGDLTDDGARFHARISGALTEIAGATSEIMRRGDRESLHVWSNGGLAAKWLRKQFTAFMDSHRGLDVELRPSDTRPDLARHEADIDIRYIGDDYSPPAGGKGIRCIELARPAIFAVASPEIAQDLNRCRAAELLDLTLLHEEHDGQWKAWFQAFGIDTPAQLGGPRLWHAHLAIEAAIEGRGVALASYFLVSEELASGRLQRIEPLDHAGRDVVLGGYVFMAREDRWSSAATVQFRHWIQAQMSCHDTLGPLIS
jgi:DNA-binding transcriptional LysR family regulator